MGPAPHAGQRVGTPWSTAFRDEGCQTCLSRFRVSGLCSCRVGAGRQAWWPFLKFPTAPST